jgi:hypothetical protein
MRRLGARLARAVMDHRAASSAIRKQHAECTPFRVDFPNNSRKTAIYRLKSKYGVGLD